MPGFGCVNGACVFGAPRDGGSGDGATDAPTGDGAPAGGSAGAGGAAGAAGAGGAAAGGGRAGAGGGGAAPAGGSGNLVDGGTGVAGDGGPDAGKGKAAAAAAAGDEGACGCRIGATDRSANTAWPLAALLLLGMRRRQRREAQGPTQ
jgi:MYXO-CTERM domain-containing protein